MNKENWRFAAFGKHPAARDYIHKGDDASFPQVFAEWVADGYAALSAAANAARPFCSWRFWTRGPGKDSLICGVVRESSDNMGRSYPFFIMGAGQLPGWEDNWDLLPLACENTWVQLEYLATHKFDDVKSLEAEMEKLRPPFGQWDFHCGRKVMLNEIGSPLDPFASFIDLNQLHKQAAGLADKAEIYVSLDRGSCTDKILPVSLWHSIFKETLQMVPNAVFLGGTLEKAFLAVFRRSLSANDFVRLWSVSSAGLWKNTISAEYSMDLLSLGREPISADRPGGQDIRYDPAYDEVQAEIDKLSSPSASGCLNWEKVVRSCADIISHKSKDLQAASYLGVALVYTRKHDGLSMGIKIIIEMMEKFWVDLYPSKERTRGRLRALEWWIEKTEAAMKLILPGSISSRQAAIMKENLGRMEHLMQRHIEGAPSVSRIMEVLDLLAAEENLPEAAVSLPFPPHAADSGVIDGSPAPHSERALQGIESPRTAQRRVDYHLAKLREISGYLWQLDPANPLVYRINRTSAWMTVEDLPPAANGRTRIPPPDIQSIKLLFDLRNSGNTEAILKAAEGKLSQFIFWLDLNRFVAEALLRLGSRYQKAHDTVCQETALLLLRLPGLEGLLFAGGLPFAAAETKEWIKGSAADSGSAIGETIPLQNSGGELAGEGMMREISESRTLIRKGRLIEAMTKLQFCLMEAKSKREEIAGRMAVCRMLMEEKQGKIALPQLDLIMEEIEKYRLDEYEPALALKALKLALTGREAAPGRAGKIKAKDLLCRIARLDMAEALRLEHG